MAVEIYRQGRPVKGVLFDMDGVILDTEKLYARFWAEAAQAMGYPMSYEQALGMRSLNPQAGQAKLESYFGPGIDRTALRDKRVELMDAYIDVNGVDLKPGVVQLMDALQSRDIPCAITTSSPRERVERYLKPHGILHRFQRICTGYEVPHGKPAPDIYLYGARCLNLPAQDCLAVEDSPAGVESAWRAGCMAVLVPDLDQPAQEMKGQLFAQADSLADLIGLL